MSRAGTILVGIIALCLLAGCGGRTRWDHSPEEHVVRTGETLFAISWRYGLDPKEVARWNKLGDGSLIHPGQVLRLTPPPGMATTSSSSKNDSKRSPTSSSAGKLPPIPTQPSPPFRWPTTGSVAVEFGKRPGSGTGVLIAGRMGQRIEAAADGRVVYSGGGLIGYGELIILKHNDTYLSAYGHNASLLVKEGEPVKKGQRIATMGEGPGREPRLHFEIRKNGEPVNPRQYLPAR